MNTGNVYDDLGYLTYGVEGFTFKYGNSITKVKWLEIESLVAYKIDLMTADEIRMDIIYNNFQITITEVTPGWNSFITKIKFIFPSIANDWDSQIVKPASATNLITLYKR